MTDRRHEPGLHCSGTLPERLLLLGKKEKSQVAGPLLILLLCLPLAACATTANRFPPGAATVNAPDHVVVFGRVEGEWYSGDGPVGLTGLEKLAITPLKKIKDWGYSYSGSAELTIEYNSNEDFYAIVPKENYVFQEMILEQKPVIFFPQDPSRIECQNFGFRIPQDASAVYIGTLVFHRKQEHSSFFGLDISKDPYFTLSIRDEYDQAVIRFKSRNPNFSGSIAKSLLRHEPVSPGAKEDETSYSYHVPSGPGILPFT